MTVKGLDILVMQNNSLALLNQLFLLGGILPSMELLQLNQRIFLQQCTVVIVTVWENHNEGCGKEGL